MIIPRQKTYSKTSKMIKGALIAAPVGLVAGTILGAKRGRKKASEEEKKEAAKKRIEENKKQIKENNKNLPRYKEMARIEREKIGVPEEDWDDLDRTEMEMWDETWKAIPKENKKLEKENKELKSGNYESILADDTPTGRKHLKRGAILGTGAGIGVGAGLGYGLHKIMKK